MCVCVHRYGFKMFSAPSDYREGLETYLVKGNRACKGVLLGQRHNDPYCENLELQSHCTQGWPDIIRINPILRWDYNHIWSFLKSYKIGIPYMALNLKCRMIGNTSAKFKPICVQMCRTNMFHTFNGGTK